MAEKTGKTIRIKWVRSGIGFTRHQKTIVRSLGLRKLNHTVVRPDTPQIRGIVAAAPHMLQIVPEPVPPKWRAVAEYTVSAPVAPVTATRDAAPSAPQEPTSAASDNGEAPAEGSETV